MAEKDEHELLPRIEKIKTRNISKKLEDKLAKKYEPHAKINDVFHGNDITFLTNELGEAITLYIGKRKDNGFIEGEYYYRTLQKNAEGKIVRSHWDRQGKVSGILKK